MSEIVHWKYYAVRDPLGSEYLGLAVCRGQAGQETTLTTVDASANMETYGQTADAEAAIREVIQVMMSLRVNREKAPDDSVQRKLKEFREAFKRQPKNKPEDEAI